jgi:hypothetical protein
VSDIFLKSGVVTITERYTADSPVPKNYLDWHQYASDMNALGVRQIRCEKCRRYSFPAEMVGGECQKCGHLPKELER